MEDPRWLRLMTIGLVLAAIAVGYFLFTGRFSSNTSKSGTQVSQASPSPIPATSPSVLGENRASASPSPVSAYDRIAQRTTKGGQPVQTLPNTGLPLGLLVIFSASGVIIGWGLQKFPR